MITTVTGKNQITIPARIARARDWLPPDVSPVDDLIQERAEDDEAEGLA